MKKFYVFLACMAGAFAGSAQCSVLVSNHTDVSCNGDCNGTVQLASFGIPSFTYLWAPGGQTVQNPSDLCPGTHTVTMTDANSCQATATVTITEPAVLAATTSTTDVTCNGNCDGSGTANVTGGTPVYTYQWDSAASNQITATASNLCPGNYQVVITDGNGCTTMASVAITEPLPLNVSSSSTSPSCGNCTDGSATVVASGGTPSYSYMWSPSGQTTSTASNIGSGTYTVTVTDAQGCSASDTIVVAGPSGILQLSGGYELTCYPNPAKDGFRLEVLSSPASELITASLLDETGRLVLHETIDATKGKTEWFDLSKLNTGMYFLKLETREGFAVQKVLKNE